MYQIKKYTIGQLKDQQIVDYLFSLSTWPISPARLASYVCNPCANSDDCVIYVAIENNQCIAFRSLLPDTIRAKDEYVKVAWMSGNWVKPEFRGQKLSLAIFNEVVKDWGDRLIFTNYSPASEKIYLVSNHFTCFSHKNGMRYYFRSPLRTKHSASGPAIYLTSLVIDKIIDVIWRLVNSIVSQPDRLNEESENVLDKINFSSTSSHLFPTSLSNRTTAHFQWIVDNPWLIDGAMKNCYPFSWQNMGNGVFQKSVIDNNEVVIGFIMMNIKNKTATIPYAYFENDEVGMILIKLVLKEIYHQKIIFLTIYNPQLIRLMNGSKKGVLTKKKMFQNYYVSKALCPLLYPADWYQPQDGDGDVAFV